AHRLAVHDAHQVAGTGHVVNAHRHAVVAAQGDGGGIHHGKLFLDDHVVGEVVVARGVLVPGGVGVVHAIDFGGLQQQIGADFHGAQRGGRIGGEERVAGSRGKQRDATLFDMADGAAADEIL